MVWFWSIPSTHGFTLHLLLLSKELFPFASQVFESYTQTLLIYTKFWSRSSRSDEHVRIQQLPVGTVLIKKSNTHQDPHQELSHRPLRAPFHHPHIAVFLSSITQAPLCLHLLLLPHHPTQFVLLFSIHLTTQVLLSSRPRWLTAPACLLQRLGRWRPARWRTGTGAEFPCRGGGDPLRGWLGATGQCTRQIWRPASTRESWLGRLWWRHGKRTHRMKKRTDRRRNRRAEAPPSPRERRRPRRSATGRRPPAPPRPRLLATARRRLGVASSPEAAAAAGNGFGNASREW